MYVLSDHLCYMQSEPPKEPNEKLLFYDFDVVNFAVVQYADGQSLFLKGTEFVFKGDGVCF